MSILSNRDIEIVHIVRDNHPYGGISGVVYFLDRALQARGVISHVITLKDFGGLGKRWVNSRIHQKLLYIREVLLFTFYGSYAARKARGPNTVVIVHGDAIGGDIYVDHGLHKAVVLNKPWMFVRNPIHIFLLAREEIRHRFKTYKRIVLLSEYSVQAIKKYYPFVADDKIITIPNGVDLERYSLQRLESKEPASLRLIFIGHEFERKGLRYVIEALAKLPPSVHLSVAGGAAEDIASHSRLAASFQVAERVHFLGRRKDIPALLAGSDVLLLPSSFESWGLVVLEAMAAGVPVLCTAVGCAEEVIKDGQNGFIIQRSSADIATKIKICMADPKILSDMRRGARETAQHYSWDAIAEKYLELARDIVAGRRTVV
jgi:UDP-glucose:(heptosyl)LPS alpha-1,3-glucosyltransferase